MSTQFTLPPDTRAVGTGDPPADMNSVVDALTAQGAACNVLNTAYAGGADPGGAADSQPAFQAAATAGGLVVIPPGTYKIASTVSATVVPTLFYAPGGMGSVIINYTGSGDCIRMYSTQSYTAGWGGGIQGLIIDGSGASAGACGVHAGDIYQLQWNVGVRKFQGSGSKGIWFDNQYFWAEDMYGHVFAQQNTLNVVFDNSANVSGTATGSFARTLLDVVLDMKGVGDGVTLQGSANLYDSRLGIYGNCDYGAAQHYAVNITGPPGFSFTATNASPCVFTAAGSYYGNGTSVTLSGGSLPAGFSAQGYFVVNASGSTFELAATFGGTAINSTSTGSGTVTGPASRIYASRLDIGMECNATALAFQPVTVNFGTQGSNQIRDCTGIIDFTGSAAFASAVNWTGSFDFDGICMGDVNLMRVTGAGMAYFSFGAIGNNAFLTTRYNALGVAAPSGNVTGAILGTNDPGAQGANATHWANRTFTLINNGSGSITFAAAGTSHVATGTSCVVPAGTAMMFAWFGPGGTWYQMA